MEFQKQSVRIARRARASAREQYSNDYSRTRQTEGRRLQGWHLHAYHSTLNSSNAQLMVYGKTLLFEKAGANSNEKESLGYSLKFKVSTKGGGIQPRTL